MFEIILENSRKLLWIFVPLLVLILLCLFDILPKNFEDTIIMTSAAVLVLTGIPLSVALRVDQWSFNLGNSISRELVLVLALLIAFLNLNFLMLIRSLIFSKKEVTKTSKEIAPKKIPGKIKDNW